jgi:mxaK protein
MNALAHSGSFSFAGLLSPFLAAWRKVRTFALATALMASIAVLGMLSWRLYEVRRDNATIAALGRGDDVPVDARTAAPEVILARSAFLLARDRREEAQALLDAASGMADKQLRARLLYNHANARIRDAIAAVQRGDQDRAIPLTRLAKDEYRAALRLDPEAWDIKYNFDVAMRMVRDFPGYESEGEDVPPDAPIKLWTDLPGVPKGLP